MRGVLLYHVGNFPTAVLYCVSVLAVYSTVLLCRVVLIYYHDIDIQRPVPGILPQWRSLKVGSLGFPYGFWI